jgi:hypothetical protein
LPFSLFYLLFLMIQLLLLNCLNTLVAKTNMNAKRYT